MVRAAKAGMAAALLLLMAAVGCGRGPAEPSRGGDGGAPSLLLVTIDTWRWDYIGASGAGKVNTPVLDRLAREGFYQRDVESPSPLTTPAHATILTGRLPLDHGILNCSGYALPQGIPTLAEAFKAKGYRTAAFVSSETLRARRGLDRGFEKYDDGQQDMRSSSDWMPPTRDGSLTTGAFLEHLHALPPRDPAFLWVHYFDPHLPYRPRPKYAPSYPGNAYAAQVAFVDEQVGLLLAALRSDSGRTWRTVVVGDHGEGLGDHQELTHGLGLYQSTLAVPLVIHPKPAAPLKHAAPWGLQDLGPTLREWFGLPKDEGADGESLFGGGKEARVLPILTVLPSAIYGVNPSLGVRKGSHVYIRHGVEELYDLSSDPAQLRDLAGSAQEASLLESLRKACAAAIPEDKLEAVLMPTVQESSAELANLKSLGYVGGSIAKLSELQKADVRAVTRDHDALERAQEEAYRTGDMKPILGLESEMLQRYPRSTELFKNYGLLHLEMGETQKAHDLLDRAVKLNPRDVQCLTTLAEACVALGRIDRAVTLLDAALEVDPYAPLAHKDLGVIYYQYKKDPLNAVLHFNKYLVLRPDAPDAPQIKAYVDKVKTEADKEATLPEGIGLPPMK